MGFWGDIFKPTPQPEMIAQGWVVAWKLDFVEGWNALSPVRPVVDVKLGMFGSHLSVDVTPEMFQKIRSQNEKGGYSRIAIVLMPPEPPKEI